MTPMDSPTFPCPRPIFTVAGRPFAVVKTWNRGTSLEAVAIDGNLTEQALACYSISQDDLATILGVKQSVISKWKNGRHDPPPDVQRRLRAAIEYAFETARARAEAPAP